MAVTVKHSTPADGTFSATGAAAWDADHNFTGTIDVANGGTGATTLTSNALLKGNGTSAISASSITDNGTLVSISNPVTLASTNRSAAAWTTSGINLIQSAATFTDTSSTGTVADVRVNNFAAQTVAATNTITATNLYGTYFIDPVAGTNVTATARYALGADSLRVAGSVNIVGGTTISGTIDARGTLSFSPTTASTNYNIGGSTQTGTIQLGRSTVSQTVEVAQGITASGSTKTVNIGTNGASGSTTNITVGSATSGATSSITANGQVTLAPIGGSRAAWTTNGVGLVQSAATFTDTTSTGTVADVRMNRFNAQTLAASNAITATIVYGSYFNDPVAGTNVTAGSLIALGADSIRATTLSVTGTTSLGSSNSTVVVGSGTGNQTVNVHTGTTTSGNTKTLNVGTGGASGSTTNITLGSSTSGATQTTTVNGQVTLAPIGGSAAAWTTSGIALKQSAATWTDTSSTGTVANVYMNAFNAQTMAASNVITVTNLYGAYYTTPVAGTNVTATNRWALAADSIYSAGSFWANSNGFTLGSSSGTGTGIVMNTTGTATLNLHSGTTASGSTKTVNIGTGGASGSTTNITLGSSTSGATQTTTINGRVTLAPIGASAAAWTTSGIALTQSAATWTDTSSTGTVADVRVNNFAAQTVAATNTITTTNLYGTYFTDPVAGTNVTATSRFAVGADSLRVSGQVAFLATTASISFDNQTSGTFTVGAANGTGTITIGRSTGTQTTNIQAGTTASGSTKTVNIGTGGASGSTTNITIGSSTSGATSTITLNGSTTCAGTIRLQGYTVATLPAAGTAGRRAYVTDATAPTWLGALTGGGTVVTPVFDNGTAWVAG